LKSRTGPEMSLPKTGQSPEKLFACKGLTSAIEP